MKRALKYLSWFFVSVIAAIAGIVAHANQRWPELRQTQ